MRTTAGCLVALLLLAPLPPAPAADAAGSSPVKIANLRYEDDYSAWEANPVDDVWNPAKRIVLKEPDTKLSFGGQERVRVETWDNYLFDPANDDEYLLNRLRLHADLQANPNLRFFAEGISAVLTHRDLPGERRPIDEDRLDLLNGFIDLSTESGPARMTLRAGRQEMSYGKQRLISPLDWVNSRRTFDAVRGIVDCSGWRADVFASRLVATQQRELNDGDSGKDFHGVYATHNLKDLGATLDLYGLLLSTDASKFGDVAGGEDRYTAGARLGGACGASGFDYDVEGGYQFGDFADADIAAWFLATQIGFSPAGCPWTPRVYAGYDYASGDEDPADDELGTFNQLFPLGHAYLGYLDHVGRQNIQDISLGMSFKPVKKLKVAVDGHWFDRAEETDALYAAGGNVARAGAPGTSTEVGQEVDVTVGYELDRHLQLTAGYGRFFAGDFLEETGPAEDINSFYAAAQYTF